MYRFCKQFTKAMQKYNIYRPSCLLPYFALNLNEKKRKMRQIIVLFMLLLPLFAAKTKGGSCDADLLCKCPCKHPYCEPCNRCAYYHHHLCECECHNGGCPSGDIDLAFAIDCCDSCKAYHDNLRDMQWYDPITGKLDPPLYDAPRQTKRTQSRQKVYRHQKRLRH